MKVSVCMATYNGIKYLKEQLDSILQQLSPSDEIIISDDGSYDGTIDLITSYKDNRIKLFYNEKKHGVITNFENAISKASGDFIFLCDQDDIWEINKVKTCVNQLHNYTLVLHDAVLIDKNGKIINDSYFKLRKSKIGYWNNLWKNSYIGCCMAFRKNLIPYLLPFPQKIEMHDRWIGLQGELHGKTQIIPQKLSRYRIHGENVSNSSKKSTNNLYKMFIIRWWMFYYTISWFIKRR